VSTSSDSCEAIFSDSGIESMALAFGWRRGANGKDEQARRRWEGGREEGGGAQKNAKEPLLGLENEATPRNPRD
jgi:hypothetical protein